MQHNLISLFLNNKAVSKILSCCAVLVFIFVSCGPVVKTHATGVSVPQPFFPITPWTSGNISENYNDLTDEQKEIADYLIGAGAAQYGGLSNYWLSSAYSTADEVETWYEKLGNSVIGRFFLAPDATIVQAGFGVASEVSSFIGSAINKAKQYLSKSEFDNEIDNADNVYLEYVPGLSSAWFDLFGVYGSLYQFQFSENEFISHLTWRTSYLNNNQETDYIRWINNHLVNVRANESLSQFTNSRYSSDIFSRYHNLFINTNNNSINICDDNGIFITGAVEISQIWFATASNLLLTGEERSFGFVSVTYNPANYSSLRDLTQAFFDNTWKYNSREVFYDDFIDTVYYGTTWANRERVYNVDDLNLGLPSSLTNIDEVSKDILVDIKGLIDDIARGLTDLKQAVLDNSIVKDNATEAIYKVIVTTDVIKTTPDVTVPVNVFKPLFGESQNGYIWYLWNMTKPLVLYTRDLLNALLFNGNGIAWIVYGVVAVGLIGGLIVKFLL